MNNCNYCGKRGHWAKECYKRQREQGSKPKQDRHNLMIRKESGDDKSHVFMLCAQQSQSKYRNLFYADSGATDHMSFQRELFTNFREFSSNECHVKVGDGRKLNVMGIGDIDVQINNKQGTTITIKDVLLAPDLDRNFLSVSRATEKGMRAVFEEGAKRVLFMKDSKIIAEGVRDNRLYKMNIRPAEHSLNVASTETLELWHRRLGHVNFKTLKQMIKNKMVNDIKVDSFPIEIPFCEGCVYGKQHRQTFPKSGAKRASVAGETFHVDLCGKMSTPSLGGANYFMLLKDDFSRYSFVYFLKDKTEVLQNLKKFFAEVQSDGHVVKRLRSDGGLEFCNDDVRKYLSNHKIKHEVTTPRAPEQNGFIERQNRTVIESAKAMLHDRQLPLHLWAEATNTAVYLKNRTSSEVIGGHTPYEKWFNRKPTLAHLKIFGSEAYVHVPKDQRSKWEKNSIKCIMVGYNDDSKAYRVYEPSCKRLLIRRDVIFDEKHKQQVNEVIEVVTNKNGENQNYQEENHNEEENNVQVKSTSAPMTRSPYNTRQTSKLQQYNSEEIMRGDLCVAEVDPKSLEEALASNDRQNWLNAIRDEIDSLNKNKTWKLIPREPNMHVITNQWVFKIKYKCNGKIDKYKARLVVRGCSQKRGIDYDEIYSPVARYDSIRFILSIAAAENMNMIQFDVKTAFLHGYLEETIYMEQPYGFEKDDHVCHLQKGLYGLKQASRQWNKRIVNFLLQFGFVQTTADACVFTYNSSDTVIYLALYVDDGLICGKDSEVINNLLHSLKNEFEITYNEAEYFVGLQLKRDEKKNVLNIFQSVYTKKILERFNHINCSPSPTPAEPGMKLSSSAFDSNKKVEFPYREAIGSLMYLMVCTRPDIAYIVGVLSRYVEKPTTVHWQAVKRIFKYLKGSTNHGLSFPLNSFSTQLTMYCDSDWAGDIDTRRSTTGWVGILNGSAVCWSSRKQSVTATSTTEAEFIALCSATKTVKWLRKLSLDMGVHQVGPTPLWCDNQQAISLVKKPEASKRTKHIDMQYFYTCDMLNQGVIDVKFVESKNQTADVLTKALTKDKFFRFVNDLGIANCN